MRMDLRAAKLDGLADMNFRTMNFDHHSPAHLRRLRLIRLRYNNPAADPAMDLTTVDTESASAPVSDLSLSLSPPPHLTHKHITYACVKDRKIT